MNDEQLIEALKERMPDFSDESKLNNMIVRAEKLHNTNGKITKKYYPSLNQALLDTQVMLKSKYKLITERCKNASGAYIFLYELPAVETKKKLDSSLQNAKTDYNNWVSQQQQEWLNQQLEEVLQEQARSNEEEEQKANAKFKASLLEALQSN